METITSTHISKLLALGESEILEFKTSFNDEALETIGAFMNAKGGVILIGVNDSGKVVGFDLGKKALEDIANKIQEATEPRVQPSLSKAVYENKTLVVITVPMVISSPISVRGRYLRRVGKTNQRMSGEELLQRMSISGNFSWDSVVLQNSSLDELNPDNIKRFMDMVKAAGRQPMPDNISQMECLRKFKLIEGDKPTRASLLLFGYDAEKYFGSAFLKLGRFRSPTFIVDDREVHGTLVEQLDGAMGWFRERLETKFVITGKPQRDVIWEYPLDAVREAVINLLTHRDYTSGAHSQIRLYDESLEFWNAGGLPLALTTDMLFTVHDSIPRNKRLAEAFFYMGLIEKWGSGTNRIAEELEASHHPLPKFESEAGRFRLYFYRAIEAEKLSPKSDLTERQQKIMDYVGKHGSITNSQCQEIINISRVTATRELKRLTDANMLTQEGTVGQGTKYKLK